MDPVFGLIFIVAIMLGAIIHEYSHAWMADYLGDPTAKYAGRLTLNPIAHIDPIYTILLPIILFLSTGFAFGAAKPVPYNPHNLRNQKWGPALVGIAGPASNIISAVILGLIIRNVDMPGFVLVLAIVAYANIILFIFNLIPVPPLDGSKVLYALFPSSWERYKHILEQYSIFFLIAAAFLFFKLFGPLIQKLFSLITGFDFYT